MRFYARRVRKSRLLWAFLFLAFLVTTLITVGRASAAENQGLGFSLEQGSGASLEVAVFDEKTGAPLPDAQVEEAGGEGGTPRSVTVKRTGYSTFTLIGARNGHLDVYLKILPSGASAVEARGKLGGWKSGAWGAVRAGAVLRSMSAMDLLHFNLDSVLSPWRDRIDVFGPREIPSNVVIPRQQLLTPLGPVTLDKEVYRLPLERGSVTRLVGVQGEAQVMDLIEAFQSGTYTVDLLNKLTFKRIGVSREVTAGSNFQLDFSTTQDLRPQHRVSVTRPPFTSDVLVVAASDLGKLRRELLPTDVKAAINKDKPYEIKTVQVASPVSAIGIPYVLTVAVESKGERISGIINQNPGASVSPGEFLTGTEPSEHALLPESFELKAPDRGVGVLVFESSLPGDQTAPAWYVFALPSAGTVRVGTAGIEAKISRISDIDLELGTDFDEDHLESDAAMLRLRRFTRSTHQILD